MRLKRSVRALYTRSRYFVLDSRSMAWALGYSDLIKGGWTVCCAPARSRR